MAKRGSTEWRANISEGTRRALTPWRGGLKVLGSDIQSFIRRGKVAPALKTHVTATTILVGEYADDLGGIDRITTGQKMLLDQLFRQRTAGAALFTAYLSTGKDQHLSQAAAFANAEARTIQLLGLERVARPIQSLAEYLEAAEDGAPQANGKGRGSGSHGRRRGPGRGEEPLHVLYRDEHPHGRRRRDEPIHGPDMWTCGSRPGG